MISRFPIRLVAFLLVPCLIADPSVAAALRTMAVSPSLQALKVQTHIQEAYQAATLELELFPSEGNPMRSSGIMAKAGLPRATKVFLGTGSYLPIRLRFRNRIRRTLGAMILAAGLFLGSTLPAFSQQTGKGQQWSLTETNDAQNYQYHAKIDEEILKAESLEIEIHSDALSTMRQVEIGFQFLDPRIGRLLRDQFFVVTPTKDGWRVEKATQQARGVVDKVSSHGTAKASGNTLTVSIPTREVAREEPLMLLGMWAETSSEDETSVADASHGNKKVPSQITVRPITPLPASQVPDSSGPQKQSLIMQAREDQDPQVRAKAVALLANYTEDAILQILAKIAANDSDSVVRQAAKDALNDLALRHHVLRIKSRWQRAMVYGSGITYYIRHPAGAVYFPLHELTHAVVAEAIGAGVKTFSVLPPVITTEVDPAYDPKRGYVVIKDWAPGNAIFSALRVYPGIGIVAYVKPKREDSRWKMAVMAAAPYVADISLMAAHPFSVLNTKELDSHGNYKYTLYGQIEGQQLAASQGATLFSPIGGDFHTIAKQIFPGNTKKARVFRTITGLVIGGAVSAAEYQLDARNQRRDVKGNNFALKLSRLLVAIFGFGDQWAVLAGKVFLLTEIIFLSHIGWHTGLVPMLIILLKFKVLEFAIEGVTALIRTTRGNKTETPTFAQMGLELLNLTPYLLLAVPAIQANLIAVALAATFAAFNHFRFDFPMLYGRELSARFWESLKFDTIGFAVLARHLAFNQLRSVPQIVEIYEAA